MPTMTPEEADWYSGATLNRTMASVIDILCEATEANWSADHTGGGCFWITTHLTDELWDGPYLALTSDEGPLAGNETVDDVEHDGGGWLLGEYDGRTDDHSPNGDGEFVYHGPFFTEELPLRAREVLARMRERL